MNHCDKRRDMRQTEPLLIVLCVALVGCSKSDRSPDLAEKAGPLEAPIVAEPPPPAAAEQLVAGQKDYAYKWDDDGERSNFESTVAKPKPTMPRAATGAVNKVPRGDLGDELDANRLVGGLAGRGKVTVDAENVDGRFVPTDTELPVSQPIAAAADTPEEPGYFQQRLLVEAGKEKAQEAEKKERKRPQKKSPTSISQLGTKGGERDRRAQNDRWKENDEKTRRIDEEPSPDRKPMDLKGGKDRGQGKIEAESQSAQYGESGRGESEPEVVEGKRAKPEAFIPRTCYFENTYLGGNAAYEEQVRRLDDSLASVGRPHRLAMAKKQSFDAPAKAGLGVHATLSRRWFDEPQRVFLQVALRGSERYGWRRPPIEMVIVIDPAALNAGPFGALQLIRAALADLGPQDSLAVVLASHRPLVLGELSRPRTLRTSLSGALGELVRQHPIGPSQLAAAVREAGRLLFDATADRTTVPGTQTVLLLTAGDEGAHARAIASTKAAHELTIQGVVTSVVDVGRSGDWWMVANAGHGNYHSAQVEEGGKAIKAALTAELESLSKVVGRLLRLNIRLAEGVRAVRVLGSRVLDQETVKIVKAREVATDRQLSRALGIEGDRGDDDDGIQTVIPYFYGGDSHVVVLELWVEKPGQVADVTLRYKDLVNVENATARTSVLLRNVPRQPTGEQLALVENLGDFDLAERLGKAAVALE
ncbi:MAG: hypothetical protein ACI9OJ_003027, partial [Myxococcota bacterium]